jgi:hypothetical protein
MRTIEDHARVRLNDIRSRRVVDRLVVPRQLAVVLIRRRWSALAVSRSATGLVIALIRPIVTSASIAFNLVIAPVHAPNLRDAVVRCKQIPVPLLPRIRVHRRRRRDLAADKFSNAVVGVQLDLGTKSIFRMF